MNNKKSASKSGKKSGKKSSDKDNGIKIILVNKKARFNYHLLEAMEVGMVLTGAEIKSIREGKINLQESFVQAKLGELYLHGAHISPYSHSTDTSYNPTKTRKLLAHKDQIIKLQTTVDRKGLTIVPTKIYLKRGRAKLEIALARGKDAPDKRKTIKDREMKKRAQRAVKNNS